MEARSSNVPSGVKNEQARERGRERKEDADRDLSFVRPMVPSLPSCLKLKAACVTQTKQTRFSRVEESQAASFDGSAANRHKHGRRKSNTLQPGKIRSLHRRSRLHARYIDSDSGGKGWNKYGVDGSREENSGYFYRQSRSNNYSNSSEGLPSISDSSGSSHSASDGLQKSNGNAWQTQIFIVGVCMLLCNLDRVAMGILAVPLLTEFNINLAEMGVLQSSYLWGYLLGQLPAGVASDKFGGTRVMICGLVLWSLATCGTALAKFSTFPLTVAIASRVLMGLGSAVALPAVAATVARNVPADQKARSTTLSYALFNIGNVLGNLFTPYVSEYVGWHWSFMIYGALGLVWAGVSIKIMGSQSCGKKGEDRESLLAQEEKKIVKKKLPKIDFRKVLFRKKFLAQLFILMYCHSTIGLGYFTLQSWIPTFMSNDLGITNLKVAGMCTALVWLATSFNTAFVGVIADKLLSKMPAWKVRKAAMTVSTVVPSICFFILSTTRNPIVGVCCILVGLVCWSFDYAGFHPYVVEVSGNYSGTVLSMTNSAGVIAGIVGNITTGYLVGLEGNFNCVFRILSGVYLVSCILWNLFMKGEELDFRPA